MYSKWLETKLKDGTIKYFEYSEFKDVKKIGKGGHGIVYSAERNEMKVALKEFIDSINKKRFVNELKQLLTANNHPNIIKFLGITTGAKSSDLIIPIRQLHEFECCYGH
ncbi:22767_t:CDS:2 [Cetraspora pellucida]|uniref:22767_t:CDS:1 n=1 Tax=Cetraspora pellucida TaxID=1433469 RepID=A0A9N9D9T6_9GLOM|nr:22767_t:CDS:2 [Cetraspora pellucida]